MTEMTQLGQEILRFDICVLESSKPLIIRSMIQHKLWMDFLVVHILPWNYVLLESIQNILLRHKCFLAQGILYTLQRRGCSASGREQMNSQMDLVKIMKSSFVVRFSTFTMMSQFIGANSFQIYFWFPPVDIVSVLDANASQESTLSVFRIVCHLKRI